VKSLRWRIALPIALLVLAALGGLTAYLVPAVREERLAVLQGHLLADGRLLAGELGRYADSGALARDAQPLATSWGQQLGARVTIIASGGLVLGDSEADPATMDNHLRRPEVRDALWYGEGHAIRESGTLGYRLLYTAVPFALGDDARGVVRVALPLDVIDREAARLTRTMLVAALLTALGAVLVVVWLTQRITRPVRQLAQAAARMGQGDLSARAATLADDEVGQLGRAFNAMAEQLQERVAAYEAEQAHLSAVLAHMADGVVVAAPSGEVRLINPAAARLLGISPADAVGRTFMQIVRHYEISDLWTLSRETQSEQAATVELFGRGLYLHVIATPVPDAAGVGSMVILQDLSDLRRVMRLRRDFVTNASHELRTPIASLKALVETLRDGAIGDPPAARHFLERMESEVDSLAQMAEELLELSRLEGEREPLQMAPVAVADLVAPPVEHLRPQAERAGVALAVDLPADLPPALADAERVQQVVTNLVHNAVKFTPPGGRVVVSAERAGRDVVIRVRDTGVGIAPEDLPRIFERFYKADRSRSGGGTGLGLAIAQHVVRAHGGRIWAESTLGEGSVFSFTLPLAPQA